MWSVLVMVGAVLGWTGWAAGEGGILTTKHNLSSVGPNSKKGATDEVCIYCHTPHHADASLSAQGVPLWNRNIANSNPIYVMYSSPTYDASTDGTPSGVSRACLSCHDGTLGINQLLNNKGSGLGISPANAGDTKEEFNPPATVANLGENLSNDHPISMQFGTARSPSSEYQNATTNGANDAPGAGNSGFNAENYIKGKGLKLFRGATAATDYVQCASCHDPHNAGNPTFLRISNTDSALCLTCHRKDGGTPLP
jgi:predicted CXXCH cytochrome family protein